MSLFLPIKQQITSILFEKKYYVEVLKGGLIYVPAHLTKDKALLHHISIVLQKQISKLPTLYWSPKLHESRYKPRFISNSVTVLLPSNLSI